jgi:hypothetical protein
MGNLNRAAWACINNDAGVLEAISDLRSQPKPAAQREISALFGSITVGAVAEASGLTVDALAAAILYELGHGKKAVCKQLVADARDGKDTSGAPPAAYFSKRTDINGYHVTQEVDDGVSSCHVERNQYSASLEHLRATGMLNDPGEAEYEVPAATIQAIGKWAEANGY